MAALPRSSSVPTMDELTAEETRECWKYLRFDKWKPIAYDLLGYSAGDCNALQNRGNFPVEEFLRDLGKHRITIPQFIAALERENVISLVEYLEEKRRLTLVEHLRYTHIKKLHCLLSEVPNGWKLLADRLGVPWNQIRMWSGGRCPTWELIDYLCNREKADRALVRVYVALTFVCKPAAEYIGSLISSDLKEAEAFTAVKEQTLPREPIYWMGELKYRDVVILSRWMSLGQLKALQERYGFVNYLTIEDFLCGLQALLRLRVGDCNPRSLVDLRREMFAVQANTAAAYVDSLIRGTTFCESLPAVENKSVPVVEPMAALPQNQQESKEDSDMCTICMEARLDSVILDCAHMCSCFACASKLTTCPICRAPVVRILKVYRS